MFFFSSKEIKTVNNRRAMIGHCIAQHLLLGERSCCHAVWAWTTQSLGSTSVMIQLFSYFPILPKKCQFWVNFELNIPTGRPHQQLKNIDIDMVNMHRFSSKQTQSSSRPSWPWWPVNNGRLNFLTSGKCWCWFLSQCWPSLFLITAKIIPWTALL